MRKVAGMPAVATVRAAPDTCDADAHATLGSTLITRCASPPPLYPPLPSLASGRSRTSCAAALVPMGDAAKSEWRVSVDELLMDALGDHFTCIPVCVLMTLAGRAYSMRTVCRVPCNVAC